ncbi:hypothetical protein [uncultured Sphingomonas sp.]|uniref:hypothetical protein n=1 Tax=uncultured Sphingomonas sp. TaxID=158754 RepID=UPI0035CA2497
MFMIGEVFRLGGLLVGLLTVCGQALAQDANTAPQTPNSAGAPVQIGDCEIHVWPAARFTAQTSGWLSGRGMLGALADMSGHAKGDKARVTALGSALDSDAQAKALGALDLSALLGITPSKIVLHSEPLDRKTLNKVSTRRSDSASSCYAELIVADLFYQKSPIYGRSLKTLFILRKFGSARDKPAIYKNWRGNGLKLFPAKGDDPAVIKAANDELLDVLRPICRICSQGKGRT